MIKCPYCIDPELKEIEYTDQLRILECPDCKEHFKQYASHEILRKHEDMPVTQYFSRLELACKRCLQQRIVVVRFDPVFVDKINCLRIKTNKPFHFSSFYRCPKHNKAVGGSDTSAHKLGNGGDLRVQGLTLSMMWALFEREGFSGMGSYPDFGDLFIHLDSAPRYSRWTRRKGVYTYLF